MILKSWPDRGITLRSAFSPSSLVVFLKQSGHRGMICLIKEKVLYAGPHSLILVVNLGRTSEVSAERRGENAVPEA